MGVVNPDKFGKLSWQRHLCWSPMSVLIVRYQMLGIHRLEPTLKRITWDFKNDHNLLSSERYGWFVVAVSKTNALSKGVAMNVKLITLLFTQLHVCILYHCA